jgi:hypothetical protein
MCVLFRFWSSAPHLEHVCPVFLRAALHINIANLAHGGDDGFPPQAATSGRVHSLDSNYTTDVLRYAGTGSVSATRRHLLYSVADSVSYRLLMPQP